MTGEFGAPHAYDLQFSIHFILYLQLKFPKILN